MAMTQNATLKPLGPYFRGQIVGHVDRKRDERQMMCLTSGSWFVVSTERNQQELAKHEIAERGLPVYRPMIMQSERARGEVRWVERPMFGAYMFACCEPKDEHWSLITNARGVRKLLSFDGKPARVDQARIDVIRLFEAEEAKKAVLRQRRSRNGKSGIVWHFSPGETVRIKEGPFAAFYAQLETAVDSRDRIKAVVSIFGRQTPTELSAFDIETL